MKKLITLWFSLVLITASYSQEYTYAVENQESLSLKKNPIGFHSVPNVFKNKKFYATARDAGTDPVFLDFVGTGDIQKAIANGQDLNANTGAGIIFERNYTKNKWFQSLEIELSISIATTSDTISGKFQTGSRDISNTRDFGSYILNPQSGKQAIYQNTNLYFKSSDNNCLTLTDVISGINCRFIASNSLWQYNPSGIQDSALNVNVGAYEFRCGVFHEFLPDDRRRDDKTQRVKYSLFLGLNYSMRGLVGDIKSQPDAVKTAFLGTTKNTYSGFEVDMGFRLNNLRLEFDLPALSKNQHVPGLTNSQFLFTIRFIGGFGLDLTTTSKTKTGNN